MGSQKQLVEKWIQFYDSNKAIPLPNHSVSQREKSIPYCLIIHDIRYIPDIQVRTNWIIPPMELAIIIIIIIVIIFLTESSPFIRYFICFSIDSFRMQLPISFPPLFVYQEDEEVLWQYILESKGGHE